MTVLAPITLAARLLFSPDAAPLPEVSTPDTTAAEEEAPAVMDSAYVDSVLHSFTFQHGQVELENGVATLDVPAGFKFLDRQQSAHVIVDLWGNPDADGVVGMILPEQDDVIADSSYAFVVQYDEMGYVKDDDADEIDYDAMLKELQGGEAEVNKERAQSGYEPVYFIGWAAKPFYDKEHKVLHWAKELKFGDSTTVNTLNYNVRVLGRKGVLVLNAVAAMPELQLVEQYIPEVLAMVTFKDGYKYEQFDSNVDEVAAWTIGGLVAGKILVKAGLFAGLLKFLAPLWKFIWLGLVGIFGGLAKWFTGRRRKKTEPPATPPATVA